MDTDDTVKRIPLVELQVERLSAELARIDEEVQKLKERHSYEVVMIEHQLSNARAMLDIIAASLRLHREDVDVD